MEYKVLTQQDRRWSGKFSPENLEHTLNSYAAEGWRVVSTFPVASPWSFSTSQVMILLERETAASWPAATSGVIPEHWRSREHLKARPPEPSLRVPERRRHRPTR